MGLNQSPTIVPDENIKIGNCATKQPITTQKNKRKKQKNIYICTWNARTKSRKISLSKIRIFTEKLVETEEKYLFFYNGKEILKQSGVGFLVHKDLTSKLKEFYGVSDRVASLTLQLSSKFILKIIQIYVQLNSKVLRWAAAYTC